MHQGLKTEERIKAFLSHKTELRDERRCSALHANHQTYFYRADSCPADTARLAAGYSDASISVGCT